MPQGPSIWRRSGFKSGRAASKIMLGTLIICVDTTGDRHNDQQEVEGRDQPESNDERGGFTLM
jgi:hypothetical protein